MSSSISFRRSLKGPDEFLAALQKVGSAMSKNGKAVALLAVILLAIGAAISFATTRRADRANDAKNALYFANKSLETEMKTVSAALAPATPAKPAVKFKDGKVVPAPQAEVPSAAHAKFDVDAKLPETVKKLQGVTKDFDGTRAAFEARLALGSLYLDHGDAAKATPWFDQAGSSAPNTGERAYALSALGYAYEGAGKFAEAQSAFERSLNQGVEGLKGDLLMGMARTQLAAGDAAKARGSYDRVIKELPDTDYARTAEQLKSQLPQ